MNENYLLFAACILIICASILAIIFYKQLKRIIIEYVRAHGLVQNIVITFKRRYDILFNNLTLLNRRVDEVTNIYKQFSGAIETLNKVFQKNMNEIELLVHKYPPGASPSFQCSGIASAKHLKYSEMT